MTISKKRWMVLGALALTVVGVATSSLFRNDKLLAETCIGSQSKYLSYSEDKDHQGTVSFKVPSSLRTDEIKLLGFRVTYDGRQAVYKIPDGNVGNTVDIPIVRKYELNTVGTRERWNTTVLDNLLWETGTTPEERQAVIKSFTTGGNLVVDAIVGKKDTNINNYAYAGDPANVKYTGSASVADSPAKLQKLGNKSEVYDQNVCVAPQTVWADLVERYYQVDFDNKVMNPINDIKTTLLESHRSIPLYLDNSISEFLSPGEVQNSKLIGWDKREEVKIGAEFENSGDLKQLEPQLEPQIDSKEGKDSMTFLMNYYYVIDTTKIPPSTETNQLQNTEVSK
jgi:hypothetical protein